MSGSVGRWLRAGLWTVVVLLTFGAIATVRAVLDGEARLAACDAALRRQDFAAATAEARAAATWYVPGAPHVDAAYARLLHVARTTEANGDKDAALFAWRSMRGAAIETRSMFDSHVRERALADDAIARLSAEPPRPMMSRDVTPEQAERHMRALLAKEEAPRAIWIALLSGGFLLMIGGLVAAIVRGVDHGISRAKIPLFVALAGLLGYVVALIR